MVHATLEPEPEGRGCVWNIARLRIPDRHAGLLHGRRDYRRSQQYRPNDTLARRHLEIRNETSKIMLQDSHRLDGDVVDGTDRVRCGVWI